MGPTPGMFRIPLCVILIWVPSGSFAWVAMPVVGTNLLMALGMFEVFTIVPVAAESGNQFVVWVAGGGWLGENGNAGGPLLSFVSLLL